MNKQKLLLETELKSSLPPKPDRGRIYEVNSIQGKKKTMSLLYFPVRRNCFLKTLLSTFKTELRPIRINSLVIVIGKKIALFLISDFSQSPAVRGTHYHPLHSALSEKSDSNKEKSEFVTF